MQNRPLHCHPLGYRSRILEVEAPHGTKPSDLLDPLYFANIAGRTAPNDQLLVLGEDGSFEATVRVLEVAPPRMRVRVTHLWQEKKIADAELTNGGLSVVYRGDQGKWCVILADDPQGAPVARDLPTKGMAVERLQEMTAGKASGKS